MKIPHKDKLLKESKTFCMAPWVELHLINNGKVYPCCASDNIQVDGLGDLSKGDTLLDAWNSVVNQTDNRWEAIMILDGGAEGKTQRIFDSISHSSLKKIKLEKNNGPYFTRTLAIKNAATDWYCQLDADDRFSIDMVKHINETINEFPDIEFIIGDSIYFDDLNFQVKSHHGILDNRLAYTLPFNGQSPIKKELFNKINHPKCYCRNNTKKI